MQPKRKELSKGIWFTQLSDKVATITRERPNAAPGWRISYFGFEKWTQATKFVAAVRKKYGVRAEAFTPKSKDKQGKLRKMRLGAPAEVKVWSLTKAQVWELFCELEGLQIEVEKYFQNQDGTHIYQVWLNRVAIIRIHENSLKYFNEIKQQILNLDYPSARARLVQEFLGQPLSA